MLSRTLPIALDGTLPECFTVGSQVSSQDTLKHLPSTLSNAVPIAHDDTLPACLTIRSQVSSQDTPKYTLSTHPSTPPSRFQLHSWVHCQVQSQLHSMAHSQPAWLTLSSNLSKQSQEHLQVCTQAHLLVALKYTPEYTLKYTPNCTRWHTPSLLGFTLPSTLPRGKALPISLDYVIAYMLLRARFRDFLSCRRQAPGGVWRVAYGVWQVAGGEQPKSWHRSIS